MTGKALAATLGMAFLFGTSFVASKVGLSGFSPTQLVFLRFAVASLLFAAVWPWTKRARLTPAQAKSVLLLALLEPGAYFFLESYGLQRTQASTASVLIATIPVLVLVFEAVFLHVKVALADAALVLASLFGVGVLLTAGGLDKALGGTLVGNLLILGAALAAAVYTLVARTLMASVDAFTVTRWQAFFAAGFYLPFALGACYRGCDLPTKWEPWVAVVYLGVACSFLAYFLLNYALSKARASLVAAFSNLIPVVATAWAVVILGETLHVQQLAGAALTVGAVTVLTLRHRGSAPPPAG
ncbi:MAG: DMT family transporter [Thermoanaerobaculum sp.]